MENPNFKYITFGLIFIIIISIIPVIMDRWIIGNSIHFNISNSDWVSFLGSYIGSIIGVIGVFLVTKMDQKQREEERKDELFLNNILLYRKISSLLNVEQLNRLQKNISELENNNNWCMIDTWTKRKLKIIGGSLYCCDENTGLFNVIENFVQSNLFNELKVTMHSSGDEFNEPIEYEDIPDEILNLITTLIINSSEIDLLYENSININISKDEMRKRLKNEYSNKIDIIYRKVCEIGNSKEWKRYLERRSKVFNNISELKKNIDARIEKVLTY